MIHLLTLGAGRCDGADLGRSRQATLCRRTSGAAPAAVTEVLQRPVQTRSGLGEGLGGEGPGGLGGHDTDPSSRGSKGEPPQRPCVRRVSPRTSHEPETSKRSINRVPFGLQITLLVPK
ncbi:hypothetical protein NDU88_001273 [Pleurodeles waltl]|uniref:Uncharacterized protein n=1 Tax=Pleurodeles waltl TaxID=8319 RepID=A0AAV7U6F5_PLEWA|nr:hypothetical protein NDU88_001273 [Pleurodeles waltl]